MSATEGPAGGVEHSLDIGIPGLVDVVEIGRGGFAVVYRARRQGFDQTVAVKVLAAALDDESRQRFEREVRAMGALFGHPHIVGIITAGYTAADRPYIVMEDMTGGSLADALRSRGPYGWQDASAIGIGLATALEAAHSAHVLHRDVKPENVLYSRYGSTKLGDFGLAALTEGPETQSTSVMVSVAHTPPEVLEGGPRTAGTDVYSLASTVMSTMLGHPPFARGRDELSAAIFKRIASDPPPDLRPQGAPDPLCRVLERALAKSPEQRYATASAFHADLEGARAAAGIRSGGATDDPDRTESWAPAPAPSPVTAGPYSISGDRRVAPPSAPAPVQIGRRTPNPLLSWVNTHLLVAAGIGGGVLLLLIIIILVATHGQAPLSFNPSSAVLSSGQLPSGYQDAGQPPGFGTWACAPSDPASGAAQQSASADFRSQFTDNSGNSVTGDVNNYVYSFKSASDASTFMSSAQSAARRCSSAGIDLPSPPTAGDQTFRASYENDGGGINDLIFVRVDNGVSVVIVSSSADQDKFPDSTIQSLATSMAQDISGAAH